jgi:hypothetical protein
MAVGIRRADYATPLYPQKIALISPTSGGRPFGIVRSQTKATEFVFVCFINDDDWGSMTNTSFSLTAMWF